MRRTIGVVPVLALLASGMVGLLPATPASATQVTTVWQLVTRNCTGNEVPAGLACFDPAGHAQDYNVVGQTSADGKTNGEHNSYEYQMPDKIAAGQANQVQLTANVDTITNGGAHSRICLNVYGLFGEKETGDACATTPEEPNGQSGAASRTETLIPAQGTTGQRITLTLGFEEPGGYVNYDYKATNPKTHVTFSFDASAHHIEGGGKFTSIALRGKGSFDALGPLQPKMNSDAEQGTATVRVRNANGTYRTADLTFRRATYNPTQHEAVLAFRVSRSALRCLPRARVFEITAVDKESLDFDMCGFSGPLTESSGDDVTASVKQS